MIIKRLKIASVLLAVMLIFFSFPSVFSFFTTASASTNDDLPTISIYGQTEEVTINNTDFFGNTISITIERKKATDGYNYFLADALRNINILENIKEADGKATFKGTLISTFVKDDESHDDIFSDYMAVTLFANMVHVWDYFADVSSTGTPFRGTSPIKPLNDVRCDAQTAGERETVVLAHYDTNWENAGYFLSSKNTLKDVFAFGDGRATGFYSLGTARDIVAHEYQHAVTQNTNFLLYKGESGAINEAFSDIFGMLVEGHALNEHAFWLIGEDISGANTFGCIRDIRNPKKMGNPTHVSQIADGQTKDSASVHSNSTIVTHALYNMYQKAASTSFSLFDKRLIGKLFYNTLLHLPSTSTFSELRFFVDRTCDLIDLDEEDARLLKEIVAYGFDKVGVEIAQIIDPNAYIYISYVDVGGKVIRTDRVINSNSVSPPELQTRFTQGILIYSFTGWQIEVLANGNIEYTAIYKTEFIDIIYDLIFIAIVLFFILILLPITLLCIKISRYR